MTRPVERGLASAIGVAALLMSSACLDSGPTTPIEPDPLEPPAAAAGFLGYSNVEQQRTVCGNCHTGKQLEWQGTAHAGAWATLAASPGKQGFCEACHSVSSMGNFVTQTNVGWVSTQNPRYMDVQCESCHGPGLLHATNPDSRDPATKPLAPLGVGVDMSQGCGQCHSGVHRPFVEEWQASRHANLRPAQAANPSCRECHDGKAFLEHWGVDVSYLEKNQPGHLTTTCGICHDPHRADHRGQLRFAIDVPNVEQNLCMMCHHKRGEPDLTTFRGPHSPEGPLLLGEAGWWPPGFDFPRGSIVGTHGSQANPRLCAGCHVNDYQLTDPLTNAFTFRSTGHDFQSIPCVDAQGKPTGERNCSLTQRSFRSCTTCHGSEAAARSALITARARLDFLSNTIQPLIAQVPPGEMVRVPGAPFTTGEGARFNMELARMRGSETHNPFLVESLLLASIRQLELDYGIRSSAAISLEPQLTGH